MKSIHVIARQKGNVVELQNKYNMNISKDGSLKSSQFILGVLHNVGGTWNGAKS